MTRAWIVDLFAALISASIVAGAVLFFGGPPWAAVGFAFIYYLLRPLRAQDLEAKKDLGYWMAARRARQEAAK